MTEETPNNNFAVPPTSEMDSIQYIGDRNAILFSAEAGEPLPPLELPDDFFNLNKDDVKVLYKELKQNRDELENMPLRTKAKRDLEENAATLSRLYHYTRTVIRVQFPDRLVLQAVFNHSETVQTVMNFVQDFIEPSEVQFHLYTAPPKSVLSPEVTLVESKLTPRALVYFSSVPPQDRTSFLKNSLMASLTSPKLASESALQYRREEAEVSGPVNTSEETPSTSYQKPNAPSTSKKPRSTSTKVPKWFRP